MTHYPGVATTLPMQEPGYVWTTPGSVRLLVVRTRSEDGTQSSFSWLKSCSIIQTHVFLCISPAQSQKKCSLRFSKKVDLPIAGQITIVDGLNHLFVWSLNPISSQFWSNLHHFLGQIPPFQLQVPSILAEATVPWQLGDHWSAGPLREVAMRQTHTVQLVQPRLGDKYDEGSRSLWLWILVLVYTMVRWCNMVIW